MKHEKQIQDIFANLMEQAMKELDKAQYRARQSLLEEVREFAAGNSDLDTFERCGGDREAFVIELENRCMAEIRPDKRVRIIFTGT